MARAKDESAAERTADADAYREYAEAVAAYTAAGGQETVQRVVTALSRLHRRLDIFYRRQFELLDISLGEWSVLQTLALAGKAGASPSRLAENAGVSPSTMTHRLDRMVERGFVGREPDQENRTKTCVRLTDDGAELFRRAVLEAEVVESRIISPLTSAERTQLASLLEKVVAGLRP